MKKSLIALVLAASLLASTSASAATPRKAVTPIKASYNTIRGKITDTSTQKPISEAVVYSVKSHVQAVSNTKSLYRLIVPKTDTFQVLKIMKKGYQTRYASFPVFGNTTYDIELTPITLPMDPAVWISFEGPTSSTLPVNSKDAQFLNLSITSNKDVEVRKLSLTISSTATTGNAGGLINTESTPNANYTDIKLVDRDTGEVLMGPESLSVTGSDTAQTLTFDTPWQIENDEVRRIGFTMDIANNSKLASDQIWVTLEPVSTVDGILDIATGQYVTDITPESQIRGNTMTIGSVGSLSIANADNMMGDKTVVAGTDGVLAAKFKATATNEDFMIKKLNFEVTNLTRGATTAVEYVYIIYPDKNGTLKTSIKSPLVDGTSGVKLANFSNLDFYVPKNTTTTTFEVYIDTNTIVSGATNSGDRIRVTFDATDATDEFEAVGQGSGTTIVDSVTSSDADISNGNIIALYKTVPTFSANTTASGCPSNSTDPTNGTNNIYCFNVGAYSSGPVDIYQLMLQVTASGFSSVGTLSLYDYNDQTTVLATAPISSNTATFILSSPDMISAGSSVTYLVKGNFTIDSNAENVSISTRVMGDASFVQNAPAASVYGAVIWSDRSATSHSVNTSDWTNGYKLSDLPTYQVTMSL